MKQLRRMLVAMTAGAALAYLFTNPRGRAIRTRGLDLLRQCCAQCGCSCGTRTPEAAGSSGGASGSAGPDMRAKIDETRRRLREQLKETLAPTRPGGTDQPHNKTTA
jgi:hypothetical protein